MRTCLRGLPTNRLYNFNYKNEILYLNAYVYFCFVIIPSNRLRCFPPDWKNPLAQILVKHENSDICWRHGFQHWRETADWPKSCLDFPGETTDTHANKWWIRKSSFSYNTDFLWTKPGFLRQGFERPESFYNIFAQRPIILRSLKTQRENSSGCYSYKNKPVLWEELKRIVCCPWEVVFRAH